MKTIILLSLITFTLSQFYYFGFNLDTEEELCFSEYFERETVVKYQSKSILPIIMDIKNPKGKIIYRQTNTSHTFTTTTLDNGYVNICFENKGKPTNASIALKYGIAAKDFSSLAKTKDLQPIDIEIEKIKYQTQNIQHVSRRAQSQMRIFENKLDLLSNKIIICSIIIISVMVFIGILETVYLKKFMQRRKLI